jgi:uridine phosphorylase
LQADIPVDSFVASTHGLGVDNLLNFYRQENNDEEVQLLQRFVTHTQMGSHFAAPYIASAGPSIQKHFVAGFTMA